jgi:hypothetical protein
VCVCVSKERHPWSFSAHTPARRERNTVSEKRERARARENRRELRGGTGGQRERERDRETERKTERGMYVYI